MSSTIKYGLEFSGFLNRFPPIRFLADDLKVGRSPYGRMDKTTPGLVVINDQNKE